MLYESRDDDDVDVRMLIAKRAMIELVFQRGTSHLPGLMLGAGEDQS